MLQASVGGPAAMYIQATRIGFNGFKKKKGMKLGGAYHRGV